MILNLHFIILGWGCPLSRFISRGGQNVSKRSDYYSEPLCHLAAPPQQRAERARTTSAAAQAADCSAARGMTGAASEFVERLGFAAAGAALVAALWLRRPPPCLLARWMAPEVRRAASDLAFRRQELQLRPVRQPLTLYLIRHGQSQANTAQERIVGGRDASSPLTSKGEAQAVAVGRRLAASGVRFDRVYASHAVRARRTAELACRELGLPAEAVRIEPRVVEFSQGSLERRPREEVYAEGGPVRAYPNPNPNPSP